MGCNEGLRPSSTPSLSPPPLLPLLPPPSPLLDSDPFFRPGAGGAKLLFSNIAFSRRSVASCASEAYSLSPGLVCVRILMRSRQRGKKHDAWPPINHTFCTDISMMSNRNYRLLTSTARLSLSHSAITHSSLLYPGMITPVRRKPNWFSWFFVSAIPWTLG